MRTAKTDQTGRMLRRILVFAGRMYDFVGFVQHHSRHKLGSEHEQQLRNLGVLISDHRLGSLK